MQVRFEIPGEPQGKGRPRLSNGHTYTPKKTADYEQLVRAAYLQKAGGYKFAKDVPLAVKIFAYMGIARSDTRKLQAAKQCGDIRPTKKPDWDNIGKVVCDALNGVAYHDDAQIVRGLVEKLYDKDPGVDVIIGEVEKCQPTD